MSRTGPGDHDLGMHRRMIEIEMLVRRVRVHAYRSTLECPGGCGNVALQQRSRPLHLLSAHLTIQPVRRGNLALMMNSDFHAISEVGKSVKEAVRLIFPDENREIFGAKWI